MTDLVVKFTKLDELVVDCFSCTFILTKALLLFHKNHLFVGLYMDQACFEGSKERIILIYARQLLNPESSSTWCEATLSASKLLLSARDSVLTK